ncbi:MAG: hypothetical protein GON13_03755, partial [Nanoarchaeota archaeon]|nr:hypothetical protein [Nanoarchaeota archaeon]
EVRKNIGTAIVAAFAFVIALVWRDAIIGIVNSIIQALKLTGSGLFVQLLTALLTTLICVVGILYFSSWSEK